MEQKIMAQVHQLYWEQDVNCASTMLICLSQQFEFSLHPQLLDAAIGLHGAGGFRAQCGLVEGALLFIGVYLAAQGRAHPQIAATCYAYADSFTRRFGSLSCYDLRPGGFDQDDPPHACEKLTCDAVLHACGFLAEIGQATSLPAGD